MPASAHGGRGGGRTVHVEDDDDHARGPQHGRRVPAQAGVRSGRMFPSPCAGVQARRVSSVAVVWRELCDWSADCGGCDQERSRACAAAAGQVRPQMESEGEFSLCEFRFEFWCRFGGFG